MKTICPLIGEECREHGCTFYCHISGNNPQTGEVIDNFECAISLLPLLLVENSNQQRQTGAAIESFRNEMASDNRAVLDLAYPHRALSK